MVDIDKTFVPNVQWMNEKYNEMNTELFNGQLGECLFNVFTTGRGSGGGILGWFRISGDHIKIERRSRKMYKETYVDRKYINKDNFVMLCRPKIELNGNYSGTEHAFLATLVHEMCHYYTYMNGWAPVQAHGREFRNIGMIVSNRSNGKFTIQRLASAEEMSELELNDEMKARKEKRITNKKSILNAVIVFKKNGEIELTMTSNQSLIDKIRDFYQKESERNIIVNNDSNIIDFLFSKGYNKNMRTWRYWNIENKPWIKELKEMLNISNNNAEDNKSEEPEQKKEKKIFSIKTTSGKFECDAESYFYVFKKIKERFPNMSDDTADKIISNPSNYRIVESKREMKDIIKEVIDEFIENEGNIKNIDNDSIEITPNMNLGLYSPLQIK